MNILFILTVTLPVLFLSIAGLILSRRMDHLHEMFHLLLEIAEKQGEINQATTTLLMQELKTKKPSKKGSISTSSPTQSPLQKQATVKTEQQSKD